jgi:hypothetical protein
MAQILINTHCRDENDNPEIIFNGGIYPEIMDQEEDVKTESN